MTRTLMLIIFLSFMCPTWAQRIRYSDPEYDPNRFINFEIIGRFDGMINIFLNSPSQTSINLYDNNMVLAERVQLPFLPLVLTHVDFVSTADRYIIFYQQVKANTAYINAAVLNGRGRLISPPVLLDSTILSASTIVSSQNTPTDQEWNAIIANSFPSEKSQFVPAYAVLKSDDRKKIMLLQASRPKQDEYRLKTILLDNNLLVLEKDTLRYVAPGRDAAFTDLTLDNEGDLSFARSLRNGSEDGFKQATLIQKIHGEDSLHYIDLPLGDVTLDGLKIRADNVHQRIILSSFYYGPGKYNITGLYSLLWDKKRQQESASSFMPISENIRLEARSNFDAPERVMNDFYLRQIYPLNDGGYLVMAELCSTYSRFSALRKRSDPISGSGSRIFTPPLSYWQFIPRDKAGLWFDRTRSPYLTGEQYTDNILLLFQDSKGSLNSAKVIHKSEFDQTENMTLSYQVCSPQGIQRVYFNELTKGISVLQSISIGTDLSLREDPIMHDQNKNHKFMPRYMKQVGPNSLVIPCLDRKSLAFALVEY